MLGTINLALDNKYCLQFTAQYVRYLETMSTTSHMKWSASNGPIKISIFAILKAHSTFSQVRSPSVTLYLRSSSGVR